MAAPVVFSAQGLPLPNTRITVFGREFHVHSVILKLHCGYFNTFIEPRNEAPVAEPAPGTFKYEYVTKVDKDGSWTPGRASDTKDPTGSLERFKGDARAEEVAFEKLLHVIYDRPIRIADLSQLTTITNMAEYLLALPKFSLAFRAALHYDDDLIGQLFFFPELFLPLAKKLRHEALFKNAFTLCLGPVHSPSLVKIEDPELKELAWKKHAMILAKVYDAKNQINRISMEYNGFTQYYASCLRLKPNGEVSWPQTLRTIHDYPYNRDRKLASLAHVLMGLMDNKLSLDRMAVGAGIGKYSEFFLCGEILDEEMPWNVVADREAVL